MGFRVKGSPQRLASWLRKQPDGGEYILRTEGLPGEHEIARWDCEDIHSPTDWGAEVMSLAQDDADGRETNMAYHVVRSFQGTEYGKHPIRCRPSEDTGIEDPSEQGQISQQMRHNEAILQMAMKQQEVSMRSMMQMMSIQDKRIAQLETERARLTDENLEATQALLLSENDEKQAELLNKMVDRASVILGPEVKKLLAAKINPSAPNPPKKSPPTNGKAKPS